MMYLSLPVTQNNGQFRCLEMFSARSVCVLSHAVYHVGSGESVRVVERSSDPWFSVVFVRASCPVCPLHLLITTNQPAECIFTTVCAAVACIAPRRGDVAATSSPLRQAASSAVPSESQRLLLVLLRACRASTTPRPWRAMTSSALVGRGGGGGCSNSSEILGTGRWGQVSCA